MNKNRLLIFPFCLALLATIFSTAFFPTLHLFTFAPFLVFLFLYNSFYRSLWIATSCGIILDIFGSSAFGLNALTYALVTFFFYRQKQFFNERPLNVPIFTYFISVGLTFFEAILIYVFHQKFFISPRWIFIDLFIMPLLDALYAVVWFVFPILAFRSIKNIFMRFKAMRR